jgi:hypothetical protein
MKISLYFLFYVALIMELLIFIAEREEATRTNEVYRTELEHLADSLAERYARPLQLTVPAVTNANIYVATRHGQRLAARMDTARVIITPVGLLSDLERSQIHYTFTDINGKELRGGTSSLGPLVRCNPSTGVAHFEHVYDKEGEYAYTVRCEVKRSIPDFYPSELHALIWERLDNLPRTGGYVRGSGKDIVVSTVGEYPFRIIVRSEGIKIPPCPQCGF